MTKYRTGWQMIGGIGIALVMGWCLALCPSPAWGQALPVNVEYEVSFRDYFGQLREAGYFPLRVEITRYGNQISRDELLYVGLESASRYYGSNRSSRTFLQPVRFESGQSSATVELMVSCLSRGEAGSLVVTRDGSASDQRRSALIASLPLPSWVGNQAWNATRTVDGITIGFFSSKPWIDTSWRMTSYWASGNNRIIPGPVSPPSLTKAGSLEVIPAFRSLVTTLGSSASRQSIPGVNIPMQQQADLQAALDARDIVVGDLSVIPENWLGLLRLDCIVLSVSDLRELANRYPSRVEAIRRWIAAGGRLVVSDCGADYRGLPSILANVTSGMAVPYRAASPEWSTVDLDWLEAQTQHLKEVQRVAKTREEEVVAETISYYTETQQREDNMVAKSLVDLAPELGRRRRTLRGEPSRVAAQAEGQRAPWLRCNYGLGAIAAHPSDFAQATAADWQSVLISTLGDGRRTAYRVHGGDQHEWKYRSRLEVPGVGAPPWMTFLCLMTGFAILVGPVAFVWLNRIGRIQWLLGVVPATALAVTTGIVTFAILQDGLGFRTVRVSATRLDSEHQVAYVHSAQAIYAGWAPNAYTFDDQTAVVTGTWRQYYGAIPPVRMMQSDAQSVTVSGGQIQARTPHNLVTMSVRDTPARVTVDRLEGGGWSVNNQLGIDVKFLLVQTPDGLQMAQDVANGQTGGLSINLQPVNAWISEYLRDRYLEEDGISDWWQSSIGAANVSYGGDHLSDAMTLLSERVNQVYGPHGLKVGEFLAISLEHPLIPTLHTNPVSEEELHVWIGKALGAVDRSREQARPASEPATSSPSRESANAESAEVGEE